MKVKNIMFSGVMAAILMGASGANAAVEIASKQYVLNQVGDKATTAALQSAQSTLQSAIDLKADKDAFETLQSAVNSETTGLATKASTTALTEGLAGKVDLTVYNQHLTDQIARDAAQDKSIDALVGADGQGGSFAELTNKVETLTSAADVTGSVANQIATSLTDYAKTSYVDNQDAATLQSAKTYTNDEIAKLSGDGGAIKTLETTVAGKADASTVTTLSGTVDGIAGRVTTAEGDIAGLKSADTAINNKIGNVAEGKTVVEMIKEAQSSATYDDTAVKADIKANTDAIDAIEASDYATSGIDAEKVAQIETNRTAIETLNGTGEGSVSKTVSDATSSLLNKPTTNTCGAESGLCVLTMANDGSLVWIDVTNPADAE